MPEKTPLYQRHLDLAGKMVEFAGWWLPVQYSGISAEHHAVRLSAGLFDVSHMGELLIEGVGAGAFLDWLLTRRITTAQPDQVIYALMCREDGTTVDDLLVYPLAPDRYLLVVNAANTAQDVAHIRQVLPADLTVSLTDASDQYTQLALQGPLSKGMLMHHLQRLGISTEPLQNLRRYRFTWLGPDMLVSRTGYTGSDGYEIYINPEHALVCWDGLIAAGALPAGLGARDSLRLEAGYPLYGHELGPTITPIEAGLGRFVELSRTGLQFDRSAFIGQDALRKPPEKTLIALTSLSRAIPRADYAVWQDGSPIGQVTSGGFSPTLGLGIAMALVKYPFLAEKPVFIEIRGILQPFGVTSLPFIR